MVNFNKAIIIHISRSLKMTNKNNEEDLR